MKTNQEIKVYKLYARVSNSRGSLYFSLPSKFGKLRKYTGLGACTLTNDDIKIDPVCGRQDASNSLSHIETPEVFEEKKTLFTFANGASVILGRVIENSIYSVYRSQGEFHISKY